MATIYADFLFDGYDSYLHEYDLPMWMLAEPISTLSIRAMWENLPAYDDRQCIAYIELEYARAFDFAGETQLAMSMPDNSERYFEVTNFEAGTQPVLYDLTNRLRLLPDVLGDTVRAYFPVGDGALTHRELFWSSTDSTDLTFVDSLAAVNFIDFSNIDEQGNYIIISHPTLMQGSVDQVQRYAQYRATPDGGNYQTTVVDITQLYDQFAWGVSYHPLSIRHFVNYAIDHWNTPPEYLLLLGKAIRYPDVRNNPFARSLCLIPSYSDTGSDVSMIRRDSYSQLSQIAVGRVNARTPDDVEAYLDKVIAYETLQLPDCTGADNEWMRHILYLSQGYGEDEMNEFNGYLQQFADTAINSQYAGILHGPFGFSGTAPSDATFQTGITNVLEPGVGLIHYYGHSSGGAWAAAYDFMDFIRTDGHYPFILSNASFTGSSFGSILSFSEELTLTPNYGAIGFIGHLQTYSPILINEYDHVFYHHLTKASIGQPVGNIINATLRDVFAAYPPNEVSVGSEIFAYGFPYFGDPAIVIGTPRIPDLEVEPLSAEANGNTINASVVLHNHAGYSGNQHDFRVRLLPFGIDLLLDNFAVPQPFGNDTLLLEIPWTFTEGNFTLHFVADLGDQIYESCESNNYATIDFSADCSNTNVLIDNAGIICNDEFPVTLAPNPIGGIFSSASLAISPDGLIDGTNADNSGTHLVEYTYNDGVCDWYGSAEVTISPILPLMVTTNVDTASCFQSVTLIASPGFENYVWADGQTGEFITACASQSHEALSSATDSYGCPVYPTEQPNIVIIYDVNISNADEAYCNNGGAVNLSVVPSGGSFESADLEIDGNWLYPLNAASGEYEINYVLDATCCSVDTAFSITINAAPQPDLGEDTLLENNGSIMLDATTPDAVSYEWSTGETTASITATPSPFAYAVSVTNTNGCVGWDAIAVELVDGITNTAGNPKVKVFPNPANQTVYVSNLPHRAEVLLLDASGKVLLQRKSLQTQYSIDVSKYASGIYFLKVIDGGNTVVIRKMVVR